MAKPHIYRRAGRWFCRLDHYGRLILAAGRCSPELAYEAVRMEITMGENPYRAEDFRMMVADRSNVSPVINIA